MLAHHPENTDAWGWACEFATTDTEKITCLKRILAIDAGNSAARRYLDRLTASGQPALPPMAAPIINEKAPQPVGSLRTAVDAKADTVYRSVSQPPAPLQNKPKKLRAIDILLIPFAVFLNIPPLVYVGLFAAGLMLYGFLYFETNTIAISGPDFDHMTISSSFDQINTADGYWKITWEKPVDSTFSGLIRHVNVDRVDMFPILSHDMLVTTGDFAKPDLVNTSVSDHHFNWRSTTAAAPSGTINLLHIVPGSKAIYADLIKVKDGDQVTISGREILKIDYFDQTGTDKGFWSDSGCNSIVVTSVNILTPAP